MIMSRADLTKANLILLGEQLMEKSDDLSDWLWEDCGCNPDAVIPNPTLGISVAIDHEQRRNTFRLGVVDRKRRVALMDLEVRGGHNVNTMWWIPIDEYVGSDGKCTLAEIVDFLGGEDYDMILKDPIMLRKMAVDMLNRYPSEGAA